MNDTAQGGEMKREEANKIMGMLDEIMSNENISTALFFQLQKIYQYCEEVLGSEGYDE